MVAASLYSCRWLTYEPYLVLSKRFFVSWRKVYFLFSRFDCHRRTHNGHMSNSFVWWIRKWSLRWRWCSPCHFREHVCTFWKYVLNTISRQIPVVLFTTDFFVCLLGSSTSAEVLQPPWIVRMTAGIAIASATNPKQKSFFIFKIPP